MTGEYPHVVTDNNAKISLFYLWVSILDAQSRSVGKNQIFNTGLQFLDSTKAI
jgi:hypothetical protein